MRIFIIVICLLFGVFATTNSALASSEKPEIFVQLGHTKHVSSVAFSPDGRFALSRKSAGSGLTSKHILDLPQNKSVPGFAFGYLQTLNGFRKQRGPLSSYLLSAKP
jgi:WD40 repeat protein